MGTVKEGVKMDNFSWIVRGKDGAVKGGFHDKGLAETVASQIGGMAEEAVLARVEGHLKISRASAFLDNYSLIDTLADELGVDGKMSKEIGYVQIIIKPAPQPEEEEEEVEV